MGSPKGMAEHLEAVTMEAAQQQWGIRNQAEAGRYSREILELSQALEALSEHGDLQVAILKRLELLLGVTDGTDKDTE